MPLYLVEPDDIEHRWMGDKPTLVVVAELLEVIARLQQIPWLTAHELRSLAALLQEALPQHIPPGRPQMPPLQLERDLARLHEQWLQRHPGAVQVLLHQEDHI